MFVVHFWILETMLRMTNLEYIGLIIIRFNRQRGKRP